MKSKTKMSMSGKINFSLGLDYRVVKVFINQASYTKNLLTKSGMENCSNAQVPIAFGKV